MKFIVFLLFLLQYTIICSAQNYKALVIGIDKYNPPPGSRISNDAGRTMYADLEGCKNDALAIKSILETTYGFKSSNIQELYDVQATRTAILKQLTKLLDNCSKGDIAFIYYAGHGSQQKNSKSAEADKKDESIVPADAWKEGIGDIRDKEQARIYNAFLDKGIRLTVIADCCHSGSMSRGEIVYQAPVYRYMPENTNDANDDSNPVAPETREGNNFLMISASQDNERAEEQTDDNKMVHGAFTLALMQALNQQPVDASVSNLFISTRAILKSNGKKQEPQLAGSRERLQQTLFGMSKGSLPNKIVVPVSAIKNGIIELMGGFAVGIKKENELTMTDNPSIVIRIDIVTGIARSAGKIIKGNASAVKPGSLFEVTNWVSSSAPMLSVFIPATGFTYDEIKRISSTSSNLRKSDKVQWVNDLEKYQPEISFWYKDGKLFANTNGKLVDDVKEDNASAMTALASGKSVFFNLPPDKELAASLIKRFRTNQNISIVTDPQKAGYMLYGTIDENGLPSYGLISSQLSLRDTLESMPLQTSYFPLTDNSEEARSKVADSVYDRAARLAKISGWLNMAGPRNNNFPFHLTAVSSKTKREIDTGGCKVGDAVMLYLNADNNYAQVAIPQKYVYVFCIDRKGKMDLVFPNDNEDNRFPAYSGSKLVTSKILTIYEAEEPAGTDNLYLLASDERINNASDIFTQEGVKRRGEANAGPLNMLLNEGNEGLRGYTKIPANWSLQRLPVKTIR